MVTSPHCDECSRDNKQMQITILIPLGKKYNTDYDIQEVMRQEHVSLQNVQVSQLYDLIKNYLEDLKFEIIH